MASPTPTDKDARDAFLEPLYPPQSPGWIKEQVAKQGGGTYKPSTTTISDALTFLDKRTERQIMMQSATGYTSAMGDAINVAFEDGTPKKNIANAIRDKVREVNPTIKSLNFEDEAQPEPLKRPEYSNHPNMIRCAYAFLTLREQKYKDGKASEKEAAFKAKLDEAHVAAVDKGVPDKLIEDALVAKLDEVKARDEVEAPPESPA